MGSQGVSQSVMRLRLDSRGGLGPLPLLLLLLLCCRVSSVSVELEILTARQVAAAVNTETRLAVYWCKSNNFSYWG